jgi:hypothetical protein
MSSLCSYMVLCVGSGSVELVSSRIRMTSPPICAIHPYVQSSHIVSLVHASRDDSFEIGYKRLTHGLRRLHPSFPESVRKESADGETSLLPFPDVKITGHPL